MKRLVYGLAVLLSSAVGAFPVILVFASTPAYAIHCEFTVEGCKGGAGGQDGGSGGGGGFVFQCPRGMRVKCVVRAGQPTYCTCEERRGSGPDGGTP